MEESKYATELPDAAVKGHRSQRSSLRASLSGMNGLLESKYADPEVVEQTAEDSKLSLEEELNREGSLLDSKHADPDTLAVSETAERAIDAAQDLKTEDDLIGTDASATREENTPSPSKRSISNIEKELPPVPPASDEVARPMSAASSAAVSTTAPMTAPAPQPQSLPIPAALQAVKTPTPDIQRMDTPALAARGIRKAQLKNGRTVVIRFQPEAERIYNELRPWSKEQVEARLRAFEEAGYDTRGFGHWKAPDGSRSSNVQAQNRAEFPDPTDQKFEREKRNFQVAVPDRSKWEAYMKQMTEDKLRKLGVIPAGDEEPQPENPMLSRSPGPNMPLSPPVPSSSSASHHGWGNAMPFSAPYSPALSTNNTSMGGMASPVSSLGRPGHLRQATVGFPFPHTQPQSVPQPQWQGQPHRFMGDLMVARGHSPANMQRMPSNLSQGSSDNFLDRQTPRGPFGEWANMNRENDKPATPVNQTIPEVDENEAYGELAYPTPRGHRHNISQNLEREVRNSSAQYYPGEYVDANEDEKKGSAEERDKSDSQTNEADSKGPLQERSNHRSMLSQASTGSASQLNVEAKEFKFKPESAHTRNFSLSKNPFMPAAAKPMVAKPMNPLNPTLSLAHAQANTAADHASSFNVAAPVFQPPAQGTFSFSRPGFDFSTPRVDPEQQASAEMHKSETKPTSTAGRIFGALNLTDIVKPDKTSKAIPIVRPSRESKAVPIVNPNEDKNDSEEEDHFDEEGRITQNDSRRKRGRLAANDGDEVPRFASPTPEPEKLQDEKPKHEEHKPQEAEQKVREQVEKLRSPPLEDEGPISTATAQQIDTEVDFTASVARDSYIPWHELSDDARRKQKEPSKADKSGKETSRDVQQNELPYPDGQTTNQDAILFPTFQEIDAVMEQLNNENAENSDFGIENETSTNAKYVPPHLRVQTNTGVQEPEQATPQSVDASHSPQHEDGQHEQQSRELPEMNGVSQEWLEDQEQRAGKSPVRKLNKMGEAPISDWDDMLSSGEELKIPPRSPFAEPHVSSLIEGLLRRHLEPFEKSLREVQASVKQISGRELSRQRPVSSYTKSSSDADDEEDSETNVRARQTKSDKKLDQIRSVVLDAMASTETRGIGQIEQEVKLRKSAESRADDLQRMLTLSEREIALYKEASENADERLKDAEEERDRARKRHANVEEELRTKTLNFTAETAALENTLDEYRASSSKWKDEIESAKRAREQVQHTIETLQKDAAEHQRVRDNLNTKLEAMQNDLSAAATNLTAERSTWHNKDQEQSKKYAVLTARLEEEHRIKSKLGEEIERLSNKEKEGIKTTATLEELQTAHKRSQDRNQKLEDEARDHQNVVARLERELSEAKESHSIDVDRERSTLQAQVEVEQKKVEHVRAELETKLNISKLELERARNEAESATERYNSAMEEATRSRKDGVREAADASNAKLLEERQTFERRLNELSQQHEEAMRNAIEDRQRTTTHNNEMQRLAQAKIDNLNEKIRLLEDKLSVSQSAAHAAARSAQQARSPTPSAPVHREVHEKISPQALRESIAALQEQLQDREAHVDRLQTQLSQIEDAPRKLHERETEIGWLRELLGVRVDDLVELVDTLSRPDFDRVATRDAAIRIRATLQMELQEKERLIESGGSAGPGNSGINISSLRSGAEAVGLAVPTLSDIQNFASPKAAQLAAAWGNWRSRRGGDTSASPTLANLREAVNAGTPSKPQQISSPAFAGQQGSYFLPGGQSVNQAQDFRSGLMTPPASNLRKTPTPPTAIPAAIQQHRRQANKSVASIPVAAMQDPLQAKPQFPQTPLNRPSSPPSDNDPPASPTTPPLMRKASYDQDAAAVGGFEEQPLSSPESHNPRSPRASRMRRSSTRDVEQIAKTTNLQPLGAWGVGAQDGGSEA